MKQFITLFKKEIMEHTRNFKLFATFIVFMIIGILSPLIALATPKILEKALGDEFGEIKIPPPTAYDSFAQFFTNMNQIGLIIFVIVFGSILTNEIIEGTLINLLTKGLNRKIIVLNKFMFVSVIWTIFYFLSGLVTYLYTIYYWEETLHHFLISLSLTWVFGLFIVTLVILFSVMTKNFVGVLLLIVTVIITMFILSIYEPITSYLPLTLIEKNIVLLSGDIAVKEVLKSLIVTSVLSVVALVSAIFIFDKREIV